MAGNQTTSGGGSITIANPVLQLYVGINKATVYRWLGAAVTVGLAGAVVGKAKPGDVRSAAIFNLVIAAINLCVSFTPRRPISAENPRPPRWFVILTAVSTALWVAGPATMFAITFADKNRRTFRLVRRRRGGGGFSIGGGSAADPLKSLCIATGAFGIAVLLVCIWQCIAIVRLYTVKFSQEHTREAFDLMIKAREPKNNGSR